MTLHHQKAREITFQMLYRSAIEDIESPEIDQKVVDLLSHELKVSKKNTLLAKFQAEKVLQNLKSVDEYISAVSTSYDIDRIQATTKAVLRLAVYELMIEKVIPPKIVIAEAIRIAKKFGSAESTKFVNALLDKLYKKDEILENTTQLPHE